MIEASLARHGEDLARLQAKIDEAKARKSSIELRMKTAKGRVRVRDALHDGRVDDALQRFGSLERRIDELEAGAEVYDMGKAQDARAGIRRAGSRRRRRRGPRQAQGPGCRGVR